LASMELVKNKLFDCMYPPLRHVHTGPMMQSPAPLLACSVTSALAYMPKNKSCINYNYIFYETFSLSCKLESWFQNSLGEWEDIVQLGWNELFDCMHAILNQFHTGPMTQFPLLLLKHFVNSTLAYMPKKKSCITMTRGVNQNFFSFVM
jgi:hypothetical protein